MASKRGNPIARAGNYAQEVDSTAMDPEMKASLMGTKMSKTEESYLKGRSGRARETATEAIRRARKANKQKPLQE